MSELPSGTVSLLFTDIEGSTQLQHRLGERYHDVVAEHRRLLETAFAEHNGVVVDRQTESFFVAFPRARYAVAAAAAAQRALAEHDWPNGVKVKVRVGIHSGDPEVAGDRYVGLAVARAARICASAHGGQVLLSSSARALLSDHEQTALRSLGRYRLKDFAEPEPISQLVVDGVPAHFPPLRTEEAPSRRKRLIVAGAVVLIAGAIAAAVLAFTSGGSSGVKVGPTSLAVIDAKSNRVVGAIDLGFKSNLIAAGEGYVWVVDPRGSTLVKIDPASRKIVDTIGIAVGAGAIPFGVAAGNGAVWVAVVRGSSEVVLELGPDVGDLRRTILYGGHTQAPALFRLNPLAVGSGAVWAIDPALGGVWRIPPHAGKARKLAEGLDALSLAAGGGAVWVAGASGVAKLDAETGLQLGSASVGPDANAETASVALGQSAVWFAESSRSTLLELDPQSASTTQTFSVGKGPSGIAVGDGSVWVANSGDGTVSRIDPRGSAARTIRLGETPGGIVAADGEVWTSPGEPHS
jgi:class 3 adenylate cyclase/DNA-binding beta-propeller fold protein YncE